MASVISATQLFSSIKGYSGEELPLEGVSGVSLQRAVEFLEHQAAERHEIAIARPLSEKGDLRKNGLQDWYAAFIAAVPLLEVFDLLQAADVLQAPGLLQVAAARIAGRVVAMTSDEKKQLFGMPDGLELTDSEERSLREGHPWAEEDPEAAALADAEAADAAAAASGAAAGAAAAAGRSAMPFRTAGVSATTLDAFIRHPPTPTELELSDPVVAAILSSLQKSPPSFEQLLRDLEGHLTDTDGAVRRRATTLLAVLVEELARDTSEEAYLARNEKTRALCGFFSARLGDYVSVGACLRALRALLGFAAQHPSSHRHACLPVCKALFAELHVSAMDQKLRQAVFELLLYLLTDPVHAAALVVRADGADTPYALNLALFFVQSMTGERDPRNLAVCLRCAQRLLDPAPPAHFGDVVASLTKDLFDVTSCYFPITFQPPPNDPHGITRGLLIGGLRKVFASTARLAPFVVPLLLEKLSSSVTDAKRDAMQTLEACLPVYAAGPEQELAPFLPSIIAALTRELLNPLQEQRASAVTSGGSSAGPGSSVVSALGGAPSSALWTQHLGSVSTAGPISSSATPIGLNFTGDARAHDASGFGLYSPSLRAHVAPGLVDESSAAIEEDAKLPLVEVALHTVSTLSRVLSQQAQAGGFGAASWELVVKLIHDAVREVRRSADSLVGRSSARLLCAVATASHHALSCVLAVAAPAVGELLPEAVEHHRWGVRSVLIALLSGMLHAVNPALDHPPGLHPLSPHLSAMFSALSSVLLAESSAPETPLPSISETATASASGLPPVDVLSRDTDARCIAAAGLCDLLVRPPSSLLPAADVSGLVSRLAALLLCETDRRVCDAVLRLLCTAASVRNCVCRAVLAVAIPALIRVVQNVYTAAAAVAVDERMRSGSTPQSSDSDSSPSADDGRSSYAPSVHSARYASEWEMDWSSSGAAVTRALHALGQLCCISNILVQHAVVPQLLFLAIDVLPPAVVTEGDATPLSDAGSLPWTPLISSDGSDRGAFRLRGAMRSRERSTSAAIVETLGRVASVKSAAGDVAAMDALVQHSPESLTLFAEHLVRARNSESFDQLRSALAHQEHPEALFPPQTSSWLTNDDVMLSPDGAETSVTSSHSSSLAQPPLLLVPSLVYLLLDSVREFSVPVPEAGVGPLGAALAPRTMDALPVRVIRAAELIFRVVSIRCTPSIQDSFRAAVVRVVLNLSPSPEVQAVGARLREAVKLTFASAVHTLTAIDTPAGAIAAAGETSSTDSGAHSPERAGFSAPVVAAANAALKGKLPVVFAPSPWYSPCTPERIGMDSALDHQQLRLLPVFLVCMMVSRRGCPVPYFNELVSQLGPLCLRIPAGSLLSCEDPLQGRRAAAVSEAEAQLQRAAGGIVSAGDDGLSPPSATPVPLRPTSRSQLRPLSRSSATLLRTTVLCAQAVGIAFNKVIVPSSVSNAAFSSALEQYLLFIERSTGIRCASAAARLVGEDSSAGSFSGSSTPVPLRAVPVRASDAPQPVQPAQQPSAVAVVAPLALQPIRAPPPDSAASSNLSESSSAHFKTVEQLQTARQRGILLLVWLCKGLAQRGHQGAERCLRALVFVVSGGGALWENVGPVSNELITLAGLGLGTVVTDCAPRHPFSREAGAVITGIYKQKVFQLIYGVYDALLISASESSSESGSSYRSPSARGSDASASTPVAGEDQLLASSADGQFPLHASDVTQNARVVPLLLSLCTIATHLPTPIILSDVDQVLPVVLRALDLAAYKSGAGSSPPLAPAAATAAATELASPPLLTYDHHILVSKQSTAEDFKLLQNACVASVLPCLRTLIERAGPIVASHLHTLVPVLLSLAQDKTGCSPLVRATAVECLHGFTSLQYHKLHPVRAVVIAGLRAVLDDPKRAVRRRAVACRNDWTTMTSGAK